MWTYLLTYCGKPVQEPDGVDDELVEESYDSSLLNRWDLKKERISGHYYQCQTIMWAAADDTFVRSTPDPTMGNPSSSMSTTRLRFNYHRQIPTL